MLDPNFLAYIGNILALLEFKICVAFLPIIGHGKNSIRSFQGLFQRIYRIQISLIMYCYDPYR